MPRDLDRPLRALALRLADTLDNGRGLPSMCAALRAQVAASCLGADPDLVTDVIIAAHALLAGAQPDLTGLAQVWDPTPVGPVIQHCTALLAATSG